MDPDTEYVVYRNYHLPKLHIVLHLKHFVSQSNHSYFRKATTLNYGPQAIQKLKKTVIELVQW